MSEFLHTVLAVDDCVAQSYALSRMLQKSGYNVLQAHNGKDALLLAGLHPDLILLDVNLPDINGFEVCRRLQSDPKTADIPVVFLTATFHSTIARTLAENVGAKSLLFYPVEKNQLLAVLEGQIAKARNTTH